MAQIIEVTITNELEIPLARQLTQRLSRLVKLSISNQARLTTTVSQVTQSLYHYSRAVCISYDVDVTNPEYRLVVTLTEKSPPPEAAGRTQTGTRLSRDDLLKWLAGMHALVSDFTISIVEGEPICIQAVKPFPPWQRSVPDETLREWAVLLKKEPPNDPIDAILQQNHELIQVLDALREKEAALEKKIQENAALEQMRDELVHALVHDLKNPLASIRSSLSGLLANNTDNLTSYQTTMIDISYQGARRMSRLVDNILDVNRFEREQLVLETAPFHLSGLIDYILQFQAPLLEEKAIEVATAIPSNLPPVDGDRKLIERVFQNLLDNAIKATPESGKIHLTAEVYPGGSATSRYIRIFVRDTGPGIPAELRGGLFEKFTTGSGRESGSGLGLAFCRLVLQAHGGEIWEEGQEGQGACFGVLLPFRPPASEGRS